MLGAGIDRFLKVTIYNLLDHYFKKIMRGESLYGCGELLVLEGKVSRYGCNLQPYEASSLDSYF